MRKRQMCRAGQVSKIFYRISRKICCTFLLLDFLYQVPYILYCMFNLFGYHMDILTIAKRSFVLRSKAFRFRYVPVPYKRVLYCTRKKLGFGCRVFSTVGSSYCSYGDISSLEALFNIAYIHPRSATQEPKDPRIFVPRSSLRDVSEY